MKGPMFSSEERDPLREYLTHAPVALALLRAIECRELSAFEFERPILDLGCGDGLFARIFFEARPEVGLDRSLRELRISAKRDAYRGLVCSDIAAIPFPDGSFATVFSNGVIEHVSDPAKGFTEIARVLRPGGRLIFTVPTMEDELQLTGAAILRRLGLSGLAQRYADAYNRLFGQISLYALDGWRSLLADNGLALVRHRSYGPVAVFRLHDLALPASMASFVFKRLIGRWCILPGLRRVTLAPLWAAILRRVYLDGESRGCSLLMVARPFNTP